MTIKPVDEQTKEADNWVASQKKHIAKDIGKIRILGSYQSKY